MIWYVLLAIALSTFVGCEIAQNGEQGYQAATQPENTQPYLPPATEPPLYTPYYRQP